jgi:capsule biosynthesis phosphatase
MTNTNWLHDHLRIVIPMAGKGTRFKDYSPLPKPMVPVLGQTILDRTLQSLPFFKDFPRHRVWFVVSEADVQTNQIDNWLRGQYGPQVHVFVQTTPLMGNLDTAKLVTDAILRDDPTAATDPILFLDSDNAYDGSFVEQSLFRTDTVDFANVYWFTQQNPDPHWCFVIARTDGRIQLVAEKNPLQGSHPIIGVFYFGQLGTFLHAANYILTASTTTKNEFYMSQVIQLLTEVGVTPVYGYEVPSVTPLGTPQDVEKFIASQSLKKRPLRICLDLDDTICWTKKREGLPQEYGDEQVQDGMLDTLRQWKADGHYIIIQTARHMRTCDGNVGKVLAKQGLTTLQWLKDHDVPYDEVWFGKPHADLFIDDKALAHAPGKWDETAQKVQWFMEAHK